MKRRLLAALLGDAQVRIAPANQSQIMVNLRFDLNEDNENEGVIGTISRDDWVATLRAVPAVAAGRLAGKYTIIIPSTQVVPVSTEPAGHGAATAVLTPAGILTISGALGDGTVLNNGTPVTGTGEWPLFKSLYGGRGLVWGWAQVATNPPQTSVSKLIWIKPAGVPKDPLYTNGFSIVRNLVSARYVAPPMRSNALDWPTTDGAAFLGGGNLADLTTDLFPLFNRFGWVRNKITVQDGNTNKLSLTITPGNGTISGSFVHPVTGKATPIKGVLMQYPSPDGVARGWFKGTNESGALHIQYWQPPP